MRKYEEAEDQHVRLNEVKQVVYRRKTKDMFYGVRPRHTLEQYD